MLSLSCQKTFPFESNIRWHFLSRIFRSKLVYEIKGATFLLSCFSGFIILYNFQQAFCCNITPECITSQHLIMTFELSPCNTFISSRLLCGNPFSARITNVFCNLFLAKLFTLQHLVTANVSLFLIFNEGNTNKHNNK